MSWKKHFIVYQNKSPLTGPTAGKNRSEGYTSRFQSWLPEVYTGMPNRTERYMQYDQMDMDSEINMALDTIAEFATQLDEETSSPFKVRYRDDPTESEAKIIKQALKQWCNINDWDRRIFKTFRNVIKYGDQPFVRDPETWQLLFVQPQDVSGVVINESKGKEPEQYIIRNLDLNLQNKTATTPIGINRTTGGITNSTFTTLTGRQSGVNTGYSSANISNPADEFHVDSNNVVHVAMTEGMDPNFPFGSSILDPIFKTYKQKELLEDSIIIYRVQRAPERRVFYIDVGDMPAHRASAFLEKVKMEVHQKRIPNKTGGGSNIMDAQYNPLSIMEDFFFAQGCLVLDTKLPLLDGRTLTLEEVIKEHQEGKENWVYGLSNVTHELEPAKIKWAGITRRDAKVLEVRLDNGESVIATPDHKFILRDGTEVEAQNLKSGDSLMPLNLELGYTGPNQKSKQYMKYVSNNNGKKKFVHTTIAKKPVGKDTQVHHIDFNSQNNNPNNLNVMTTEDHIALHKSIGTYALTNMWKTEEGRNKLISGMKKLYENPSEKFTISLSKRNSKNAKKYWNKFTEEEKKAVGEKFVKTLKENTENRKIKYSIEMFNAMVSAFDRGHTSVKKLGKELRIDDEFHNAYLTANPSTIRDPNMSERLGVTDTTLNRIVNVIGYKTFGDWKVEYTGIPKYSNKVAVRQNHKILEVIELDYTIDTGDITIESESGSHWFGLGAGIYVHNSDGRGSKVEVLPGGDNLGEISDLKFFTDKMMRGLRIPSSYMPLSSDDSGAVFTDGRVGTAFIQEFRFNKYCQRLQNIIQPVFDREFKRFLKHRGFNIDASMFDLIFTEPQSFSQYRQIELDSAKAGVFGQLEGSKYLSRRFLLKKYLGLSPAEILENEQMYMEENPKGKIKASDLGSQMGLGDVGIRGNEFEDFGDLDMEEPVGDELGGEASPETNVSPIGGTQPAQGGQEGQQR